MHSEESHEEPTAGQRPRNRGADSDELAMSVGPGGNAHQDRPQHNEHHNEEADTGKTAEHNDAHDEDIKPAKSRGNEPRSEKFDREWEPFRDDDDLELQDDQVTGPVRFMDPTHATFTYTGGNEDPTESFDNDPGSEASTHLESSEGTGDDLSPKASAVQYEWTSRNNRKGRHALVIVENDERANPYSTPPTSRGPRPFLRGIWRMLTIFTIHDVSYVLAVVFTLACAIFTVNGVLSLLPYTSPDDVSESMPLYYVQGALSALGSSLFFFGSLTGFSEAVNTNRKGCFGWKLQHITKAQPDTMDTSVEDADVTLLVPDGSCSHHHDSYRVVAGHPQSWHREIDERKASSARPWDPTAKTKHPWIWLPSLKEVRTHLRYDFGFVIATTLACSSLLYCAMAWASLGSTIASGEVAQWIRIPQVIAAAGFTAASLIATVETQRDWWRPSLGVLGWHANVFNAIGSVGFLLTAVFGYMGQSWAQFQFGSSFLWGSLAFLIGSLLQWYEALDKYPVERKSTSKDD
ncbi:hypothetical protein MBLNU230_g7603t1 [Neophaeotheca triangularis]